jgi:purine-binding chemotaxis protein CheW
MDEKPRAMAIVCRAGARLVAVPLAAAVETMRPLPVDPLPGAPPFVRGAAVVRGAPTPVLDVAHLLGERDVTPRRFVTVDAGGRTAALAVTDVLGVRDLAGAQHLEWPSVVGDGADGAAEEILAFGQALLVLLRHTRLVPEATWAALAAVSQSPAGHAAPPLAEEP